MFLKNGPVSNNKLELNVDISRRDFSSKVSYSVTKNGSEINGYSFENTNFCPSGLPTKYVFSVKSNLSISSNVYWGLSGNLKSIKSPLSSYRFNIN